MFAAAFAIWASLRPGRRSLWTGWRHSGLLQLLMFTARFVQILARTPRATGSWPEVLTLEAFASSFRLTKSLSFRARGGSRRPTKLLASLVFSGLSIFRRNT